MFAACIYSTAQIKKIRFVEAVIIAPVTLFTSLLANMGANGSGIGAKSDFIRRNLGGETKSRIANGQTHRLHHPIAKLKQTRVILIAATTGRNNHIVAALGGFEESKFNS